MGSPVGNFLQNKFTTVEQIPKIDKSILRDSLQNIDTATLLAASKGFDQDIIDALFSVRPTRERKLLQIELEQNPQFSEKQVEHAQKTIMRAIRQTLTNQNSN